LGGVGRRSRLRRIRKGDVMSNGRETRRWVVGALLPALAAAAARADQAADILDLSLIHISEPTRPY